MKGSSQAFVSLSMIFNILLPCMWGHCEIRSNESNVQIRSNESNVQIRRLGAKIV